MELFKETSSICGGTFSSLNNKKKHPEEISYNSGNATFLPQV